MLLSSFKSSGLEHENGEWKKTWVLVILGEISIEGLIDIITKFNSNLCSLDCKPVNRELSEEDFVLLSFSASVGRKYDNVVKGSWSKVVLLIEDAIMVLLMIEAEASRWKSVNVCDVGRFFDIDVVLVIIAW